MSLLFPAGLGLSALAVPLVALYFLRLRRRRVVVPSLLPWHALRKREDLASPFQRFRRHFLLWLQLLALLLLALAFARPASRSDGPASHSVVLLIDASASMGATDGSPTRLDEAVARARARVDALATGDEVMVVAAGAQTEVVAPFTRERDALDRALGALRPTEAAGDLREGVSLALGLARAREAVSIVVLTDGGGGALPALPPGTDLAIERVGAEDANAGIVALDVRRSSGADEHRELFVTAEAFGREPLDATLQVWLEDTAVGVRNLRLTPEAPEPVVFALPRDTEGTLHVALDADPDHLPADDDAWAVIAREGVRSVLLVGGDALTARILANDPRIRADQVPVGAATRALLGGYDAVLFAGAVPDAVDGLDYAVLGPYPGSPVAFGDPIPAPRVASWQRAHPVVRNTRWDDVLMARSRAVLDPAGLAAVVDGERGPLVLAGRRDGGRVVQLAFDPFESDLPLRVAWPVFVLDTVGWLTADAGAADAATGLLRTGEPWVRRLPDADADATPILRGPGGRVSGVDGALRVVGTDAVGVYEVRAGATSARFAANLLSPEESRIAPRDPGVAGDGHAEAASRPLVAERERWRPVAIAALAVLCLEWLAWNLVGGGWPGFLRRRAP